jgi:hypothetical protein
MNVSMDESYTSELTKDIVPTTSIITLAEVAALIVALTVDSSFPLWVPKLLFDSTRLGACVLGSFWWSFRFSRCRLVGLGC